MSTYYFGLNINRSLSEVSNTVNALKNLNLDIKDLNKIRGLSAAAVEKTDLQTLSGLNFDAEKVTTAINTDTRTYEFLSSNVFDKYSVVATNINLNGSLAAAAYKYNYVDFAANTVKQADVSTSRVSSWSTLESPINEQTPIFYGGTVTVEGPIELSSFNYTSRITPKKYASEIPTHKIAVNIGGQNVYVYAMKGIPLTFNGFFSTATVNAAVTSIPGDSSIRPTWVVRDTNVNSTNPPREFINVLLSGQSSIQFSAASAVSRTIELYYPPNNITSLNLPRINLLEVPKIILPNLVNLNLNSNDLREFPDLSAFTNLRTLNLSFNNFTRAANSNLRSFTTTILSRIPTGVTSLTLGNAFGGNITANLATLSSLNSLDLSCTTVNDRRYTGTTPAVNPATIQNYNMNINRFAAVHSSVLSSTTLTTVNLSNNILNQNDIAFASADIQAIVINSNGVGTINLVHVPGKSKLQTYNVSYCTFNNNPSIAYPNNVENIFNGCSALQTISLQATNAAGNFPKLISCSSLRVLDLLSTTVGGANNTHVLTNNSFDACRNTLQELYIESPNIVNGPIEANTFRGMFALSRLYISSRNRGLSGTLTNQMFADCRSLVYVWLHNNRLTGTVPSFNASTNLYYLYAPVNQFEGDVPNINKPNFRYLILNNNRLTTFGPLDSTNIWVINLANNLITSIPNLSNLTSLQELYLNGNQVANYSSGAFATLTSIRILNLNSNLLTQGAVDQILRDLNKNFDSAPRRGVTVNLRGPGNSPPSTSKEIRDIITKLSAVWTVAVN